MKACARLVAEAGPGGATRLTTLAGQAPLLLRRTGAGEPIEAGPGRYVLPPGQAHVHLVGGAAGPLGGDELSYRLDLGPGARVRVGAVAASIALPGPPGLESGLDIRAVVGEGGELCWAPQPLIVARGARHRTHTLIDLAAGARLVWRDEIQLGRRDEDPGSVSTRLRVRRAGRPLFDHELALGPRYPGSLGPAVTGGHRASGMLLIVDPAWAGVAGPARLPLAALDVGPSPSQGVAGSVAVMPLSGPAVLVSAVAADGLILRRLLDAAAVI